MQKIATQVFIFSSISFGIIGVVLVIATGTSPYGDGGGPWLNLLAANVFIILASFGVSVAGKYLGS